MKTKILPTDNPEAIPQALTVLRQSGVVAFPTDTVYGVAAAVDSIEGIHKLFRAKERDASKAIPVLMSSADDLELVSHDVNQTARTLAEIFWPGALTLIIPRNPSLPEILGPYPTVGVRVPDHPDAIALMKVTGPLAVTSANLSGAQEARTAQEVYDQLEGRIDLVLDGGMTPGGRPSTVVDCTTPELQVLRSGPISIIELKNAFI